MKPTALTKTLAKQMVNNLKRAQEHPEEAAREEEERLSHFHPLPETEDEK